MRAVRLTFYFILGLLLGGYAVFSFAETVPAVMNPATTLKAPSVRKFFISGSYQTAYDSFSAVCAADRANKGLTQGSCVDQPLAALPVSYSLEHAGYCRYYNYASCSNHASASYQDLCPQNYGLPNATGECTNGVAIYSCPVGEGWTLDGQSCTRVDCGADEERVNGVCVPKCDTGQIRKEDGTCRPYCWGAQFYDEGSNTCRCTTQLSQTSSWTVTAANAKAGKLDPPSCVNGCEQGPDPILGFIGSFCPGGLVSMVTGGSTTCYGKIVQTGATCAPDVSAPAGSLMPVSVSPAPAGTGPTGTADPYSTTANNADPTTCAAAGGNWGVFNGQGNCYTPTTADPMVTQKSDQSVVTNADGSKQTTTTTTTSTCTGAGSCTSTSATTINNTTTNGGSSSTSVTVNNGSGTGTGTATKTAEGQYKIDLPKDYQKDSTGLRLNSMVSEIKDAFGRPSGDDALITGAKASDEAMGKLRDADKLFGDGVSGQSLPGVDDKVSLWEQTMREGWWEPISIAGCSPFSHTFNFFSTSYTWTLDHCPTAAKISEIGAYCMWILLLFSGFRMLTTPRGEM